MTELVQLAAAAQTVDVSLIGKGLWLAAALLAQVSALV